MTEEQALKLSPLDELHRGGGGRMVPFAGWSMPVQFAGIIEEHNAVRNHAGIFDVSHMGRLLISGRDATALLKRTLTYNVDRLKEWQGHYALLCQEDGGIIDDILVYKTGADRYVIVDNCANADRDRGHLARLAAGMNVALDDRQMETAMIALQGPEARARLAGLAGPQIVERLPRHACAEAELFGGEAFIAQGGYTGEDGFEIVTDVDAGRSLWQALLAAGVPPCGLGARDTLRLEAALHLYGNDMDTATNPFEAGLGWVVDLDERDFVGKAALLRAKAEEPRRRLACLRVLDKGIMRAHCDVLRGQEVVGTVTSGGFSPTLGVSIGMAYLPLALAAEGTALDVDVRGRRLPVTVVKRPFYKRPQ